RGNTSVPVLGMLFFYRVRRHGRPRYWPFLGAQASSQTGHQGKRLAGAGTKSAGLTFSGKVGVCEFQKPKRELSLPQDLLTCTSHRTKPQTTQVATALVIRR